MVIYQASRIATGSDLELCDYDLKELDDHMLSDVMFEFVKKAKEDNLFSYTRSQYHTDPNIYYDFKINILKEKWDK